VTADDDRGCYDPVYEVKFNIAVSILPFSKLNSKLNSKLQASKFSILNYCRYYSFRSPRIRYNPPLSFFEVLIKNAFLLSTSASIQWELHSCIKCSSLTNN
jgi:hypothetical protein